MSISTMRGEEEAGGEQGRRKRGRRRKRRKKTHRYFWNSGKGCFQEPTFNLAIPSQGLLLCSGNPGDLWFLMFTVLCAKPHSQIGRQEALQPHSPYFSQTSLFSSVSILLMIPRKQSLVSNNLSLLALCTWITNQEFSSVTA